MVYQKHVFINLPSKDVDASVRFATGLGLTKKHECSEPGSSNKSISVSHGEGIEIFYHSPEIFSTWLFPGRKISDSTTTTQALVSLSAESKEGVDEMINGAVEAGGKRGPNMVPNAEEYGLYSRSVEDLDGHVYEIVYMDESRAPCTEKDEKKSG